MAFEYHKAIENSSPAVQGLCCSQVSLYCKVQKYLVLYQKNGKRMWMAFTCVEVRGEAE